MAYAQLCGDFTIPDFVIRAPGIQYLSTRRHVEWTSQQIRGNIRILDVDEASDLNEMKLGLPKLQKLIIRKISGNLYLPYISNLDLPIKSVNCLELNSGNVFRGTKVTMTDFLRFISLFPGVESVYYPIAIVDGYHGVQRNDFAPPTPISSIRTIGLHAGMPTILAEDEDFVICHVEWICSGHTPFSNLEEVMLCGLAWRDLSKRSCFKRIINALMTIGVPLTSEHELFISSS